MRYVGGDDFTSAMEIFPPSFSSPAFTLAHPHVTYILLYEISQQWLIPTKSDAYLWAERSCAVCVYVRETDGIKKNLKHPLKHTHTEHQNEFLSKYY